MTQILLALLALAVLAAVVWRLVALPLPGRSWRSRGGHAAWVLAHVSIGAGAAGIAATLVGRVISPLSLLLLLAGLAVLLLGRWRRRSCEQQPTP